MLRTWSARSFARIGRRWMHHQNLVQSYVHGTSDIQLKYETIAETMRKACEKNGDKEFLIFREQNIRKSFAEVYADSRQLAAGLIALGLRKGDRVGVWGVNYYEWTLMQFATAIAGMVQVNINPFYRSEELRYAMKKVGIKAIVTPRAWKRDNYMRTLMEVVPTIAHGKEGRGTVNGRMNDLPELEHVIVVGEKDPIRGAWQFDEILKGAGAVDFKRLEDVENTILPDDAVNIQYTSGTTGNPKAATLSHHGIINDSYLLGLGSNWHRENHRILISNPLYHCFGCVMGVLNALNHTQTCIFPSVSYDSLASLRAIEEEKATFIFGTPTIFIDFLTKNMEAKHDMTSVTGGYIAGAPCPKPLCERLVKEMNMKDIYVLYGSTELSSIVTMSRADPDPFERIKNVGYVFPHTEIRIVDTHGNVMSRGQRGELHARGYMVMRGYWGDEQKTREDITPDRWYHTGDTASMNADGSINIVGRSKDMICRGGENIYPTEIETFLFKLPYIADAQVIGLPDDRYGEIVCAWIRLKPEFVGKIDDKKIKDDCKSHIAYNKVPAHVLIKEQKDFPLTATGKVKKNELRKMSKVLLGLDAVKSHFNDASGDIADVAVNDSQTTKRHLSHQTRHLQSYVQGTAKIELKYETIAETMRKACEKNGDKEFLVFKQQNIRKNFAEVYDESRQLAAGLFALGLRKGDRVGVWGVNYYEWTLMQFATAIAGMIQVNINPFYRSDELRYALKKVGVKAIVTPRSWKRDSYMRTLMEVMPIIAHGKEGCGAVEIRSKELPELEHVIVVGEKKPIRGAWQFHEIARGADSEAIKGLEIAAASVLPDDPVNIQFTSGTTGSPKAATLTHNNVVNNSYLTGLMSGWHLKEQRALVSNPLYHCIACVMGVLNALNHNQTCIFPSVSYEPLASLRAIEEEKATFIFGTPTMFIDLLSRNMEAKHDMSSVTGGYIGGAPCPRPLCERLVNEMNMRDIYLAYGSTELSPVVTMSRPHADPFERVKNVGYALPHTELRIVDNYSKVLPRGERGELHARGYMVMREYWGNEEKTREEITPDRWYHTGDTASMNEDGSINIVGRSKDMICRGGENIYPTEIETFLFKLPYIADAQIVGVPDERYGEAVCAWIRLKSEFIGKVDENQIKEDCKKSMAYNKVPAYVLIKEQKDFPLTATGKVKKSELRKMSKALLALDSVQSHFNDDDNLPDSFTK